MVRIVIVESFGDEEASMLLIDVKGIAHFKKKLQDLLKVLMR